METLIWCGAGLTLLGVIGLLVSALVAVRAKRSGLDDARIKERLQKAIAINLGALFVSALGLIAVVAGVILS